jgi:Uma2 family endonuclease
LPDKDGTFSLDFQQPFQSSLLTDCLWPHLAELYPDGQFCIGCDRGIYWRATQPPLDGCQVPDWFLVRGVPPMLDGKARRSYVLWQEVLRPLLVIEYALGDSSQEHDVTPFKGKFWVYDKAIGTFYYAIFDPYRMLLDLFGQSGGSYRHVLANAAGRFPIEWLGIELGIWEGVYRGMRLPWLRVWDSATGKMLPTAEERAEKLAEKLRALGIDPEA